MDSMLNDKYTNFSDAAWQPHLSMVSKRSVEKGVDFRGIVPSRFASLTYQPTSFLDILLGTVQPESFKATTRVSGSIPPTPLKKWKFHQMSKMSNKNELLWKWNSEC